MTEHDMIIALVEGMKDPVVITDTDHMIRYINQAAIRHYDDGAAILGRSLLDCHNEASQQQIHEVFAALQAGEEERFIGEHKGKRIFMRAIRDKTDELVGYYERYEPAPGVEKPQGL